jgi:4-amino-4-deoxy-L-arabinose transferase-like glycosyltransferase
VSSKTRPTLLFFLIFTAATIAMHLPYLKLPYHWDELGQFIPASLDIYQKGAWIPQSTLPNVHPPAVMAYLALVWKIFGYSIPATRVAMLLIASAGLLFSFLLAIRLSRKAVGAPAFAAIIFMLAAPMFYTQSMMAQLDMPAMALTALALLLFLEDRFAWCAAACTLLVLVKETGISTPLVLAAWLWIRDKRIRQSLYFLAPALALAAWLIALHHATGHWLGNAEFAQYNVSDSLQPAHIAMTLERRLYFLFLSDGLWIGAITLFIGARVLKGREWTIAFAVAGAQLVLVSVFGGASLDRYTMPLFPVVFAAMAAAGSALPRTWRWTTQFAMTVALVMGLFFNPPYPFSFENNLAMADFVALQKDAADYLQAYAPNQRIASAWPFVDAVARPEFGYVDRAMQVTGRAEDFRLTSLADLERSRIDVLVVFSRTWALDGGALDYAWVRKYIQLNWGHQIQASPEQIRAGLGFVPVLKWTRHGQWIEIYLPERIMAADERR